MNIALKATCALIYLLAVAAFFTPLPFDAGRWVQLAAAVLLVTHALEVPLFLRHIRRYEGPLAVSIALTVLFGFLHWLPLARAESDA